jgi:hypothetical protein
MSRKNNIAIAQVSSQSNRTINDALCLIKKLQATNLEPKDSDKATKAKSMEQLLG